MCHKLLEAYKQMLSKDVQIFLATVIPDMDEGTRANILATIAAVHAQYGGYTREKGEFNFACIGEIPKFTSAVLITSGILALDELYLERAGWATVVPLANYGYEDAVMKGHLIDKMGQWSELAIMKKIIERDVALTYADVRLQLLAEATDMRQKAILAAKNATKDLATYTRLQLTMLGQHQEINPSVNKAYVQPFGEESRCCFNCGLMGHLARVCPNPVCNRCSQEWSTVYDPTYHHCSECPMMQQLQQSQWKPAQQHPPSQQWRPMQQPRQQWRPVQQPPRQQWQPAQQQPPPQQWRPMQHPPPQQWRPAQQQPPSQQWRPMQQPPRHQWRPVQQQQPGQLGGQPAFSGQKRKKSPTYNAHPDVSRSDYVPYLPQAHMSEEGSAGVMYDEYGQPWILEASVAQGEGYGEYVDEDAENQALPDPPMPPRE